MAETQFTPGPWYVGAQNDALFIVAGRPPASNNDYPWHEAPRVALAKVFGPSEGDCLPIDADANARLIAAAPELLEAIILVTKRCGPESHDGAIARAAISKAMGK